LDEDKKGDWKEEEAGYQVEESEVFGVGERTCRIDSYCVFFCCDSSCMMPSFVFCLELGLIKG
jgi:hypothetical protein